MTRSIDLAHSRPDDAGDEDVAAAGKMSEALERLERARGHLHAFHQLIGETDLMLDDVIEHLRAAGREELAVHLATDLVGRNVIAGRWTFQVIEEFDDDYWTVFREHERAIRDDLMDGRRHVFEAEMKARRRTEGRAGHEAHP